MADETRTTETTAHDLDLNFSYTDLTLDEWRRSDDPKRARYLAECPQVVTPLGLDGEYDVELTVMDERSDYFLPPLTIRVAPTMSALDVLQLLAAQWTAFPVMNDFTVSSLTVRAGVTQPVWFGVLLDANLDELTDIDLAQMPFEPSGEDVIVSPRDQEIDLAFFERFAQVLDEVDEGWDEDDTQAPTWVNRLGNAWEALGKFAERMGPDFFEVANRNGRLNHQLAGVQPEVTTTATGEPQ